MFHPLAAAEPSWHSTPLFRPFEEHDRKDAAVLLGEGSIRRQVSICQGREGTQRYDWTLNDASVVSHKRLELFFFVLRERGNVQPG
jgi:hypothetical protein